MPTVYISAVGIEQDGLLVWREGPLIHFAITWRKKFRRPSSRGQRIQMLPAVFFGSDYKLIVGGPIDDAASGFLRHFWKRSLRRRTAAPNFFGGSLRGVCHPDGPGVRLIRSKEASLTGVAGFCWLPHEGDAPPVQRPDCIAVLIHRRRHKLNRLCSHSIDTDQAVLP